MLHVAWCAACGYVTQNAVYNTKSSVILCFCYVTSLSYSTCFVIYQLSSCRFVLQNCQSPATPTLPIWPVGHIRLYGSIASIKSWPELPESWHICVRSTHSGSATCQRSKMKVIIELLDFSARTWESNIAVLLTICDIARSSSSSTASWSCIICICCRYVHEAFTHLPSAVP